MRALKILQAGDLHLDSPFGGLGPEKARLRRQESRELADRLAEAAREEGADLLLLTGDLFDGGRVYPETLERLTAALGSIDCPVCISPGNHDPYGPDSPYAQGIWPRNVHIFKSEAPEALSLPELGCTVWGGAFTSPRRTDCPLLGIRGEGLAVGCFHGDVCSGDSVYGPITREQIRASDLRYLALGHIHEATGLRREGGTCWAYSGCTEGRGFDELGDKGALLVELTEEGVTARALPLCRRRYLDLQADTTGTDPRAALERALSEARPEDICRVTFVGETASPIGLGALELAFGSSFFGLELRDNTRPSRDIWDKLGEDSLRGLFLQGMRERYDAAADDHERELVVKAVRFGLGALDGRDME